MKVFGLWERLTRIIFIKTQPVTIEPVDQLTGADKAISIPDMVPSAQQMVLANQTQTLTNKTIDAAGTAGTNTITNIKNASVASDAAIAGTKVAPDFGTQLVETDGSVSAGISLITNTIDPPSETLQVSATGAFRLPVGNNTTERPAGTAADLKGMLRYNDTDDVVEMYKEDSAWTVVGTDGSTSIVAQVAHGFVEGDVLYLDVDTDLYAKAKADSANTAEVVGVVKRTLSADSFELLQVGELTNLISANFDNPASLPSIGEVLFLSPDVAGKFTTTEPPNVGQISVPIGIAKSTNSIYVQPKRGATVGSVNVRTRVQLYQNTFTAVQDVSAFDGGTITGWIYIQKTNPANNVRFALNVEFIKGGAGGWYSEFSTPVGQPAPVGLNAFVDSAGLLQINLPTIATFASAYFDYAINAPAAGASLTLSTKNLRTEIKNVASSYSIQEQDNTIFADCTSSVVITLPSALLTTGKMYTIKSVEPTLGTGVYIEISTGGSGLIDKDSTNKILLPSESITLISDGVNWTSLQDASLRYPRSVTTTSTSIYAKRSSSFRQIGGGSRTLFLIDPQEGQQIFVAVIGTSGNVITWNTGAFSAAYKPGYSATMTSGMSLFSFVLVENILFVDAIHGYP